MVQNSKAQGYAVRQGVKMWLPNEDVKSAGPCTITASGRSGRAFVADPTVQHMTLGLRDSALNVK
jgi:hypothetical protein